MIKTFSIAIGASVPLLPGLAHAHYLLGLAHAHYEGETDLSTGLGIVILLAAAFAAFLAARSVRNRNRDR